MVETLPHTTFTEYGSRLKAGTTPLLLSTAWLTLE